MLNGVSSYKLLLFEMQCRVKFDVIEVYFHDMKHNLMVNSLSNHKMTKNLCTHTVSQSVNIFETSNTYSLS